MPKAERQRNTKLITNAIESFENLRPVYNQFTDRVAELLNRLISDSSVKIHAVEKRTKSVDSLRQKIARPRKSYTDPLSQIHDLSGVRIIVYYQEDVQRISKLIESEFVIDKEESGDVTKLLAPDQFGYRSVHYVVSLSRQRLQLKEWQLFSTYRAEIQVRTVLQHAWAAISHALHYKHESEVRKPLARRLFRLSGLLELADEEFGILKREKETFTGAVAETFDSGIPNIPIDRTSLKQYLERASIPKELEKIARQAGFSFEWFDDDAAEIGDALSELGWSCSQAGIQTITELDLSLRKNLKRISPFLFKLYAVDETEWRVSRDFVLQLTIFLIFKEKFNSDALERRGWGGGSIAKKVLSTADFVLAAASHKAPPITACSFP